MSSLTGFLRRKYGQKMTDNTADKRICFQERDKVEEFINDLLNIAEAAKTYFKKQHCTCLDGDECPECRENRERCENLLGKFK